LRRTTLLLLLVLAVGLVACADGTASDPSGPEVADRAPDDGRRVVSDGREVVLEEGAARRVLTALDPERDGELEHIVLRPGEHPTDTVLLLARTDERYELRYLVIDEDEVSDLYWFPWRLQVDEGLLAHGDVPPRPVWSPDGGTVAWLEGAGEGTRLRTVDWMPDEQANNPSEASATYHLADVPEGAQLERWERAGGTPTLVATDGETDWRIELRTGAGADAMQVAGRS
jgi:hypothetical protein